MKVKKIKNNKGDIPLVTHLIRRLNEDDKIKSLKAIAKRYK